MVKEHCLKTTDLERSGIKSFGGTANQPFLYYIGKGRGDSENLVLRNSFIKGNGRRRKSAFEIWNMAKQICKQYCVPSKFQKQGNTVDWENLIKTTFLFSKIKPV